MKKSIMILFLLFFIFGCGGKEAAKKDKDLETLPKVQVMDSDGKFEGGTQTKLEKGSPIKQEEMKPTEERQKGLKEDNLGKSNTTKDNLKQESASDILNSDKSGEKAKKSSKAGKGLVQDEESSAGFIATKKENDTKTQMTKEEPERKIPAQSGLKAGFADDNKQFNFFVKFLKQFKDQVESLPLQIDERIMIKVKDKNQKPIANALISISDGENLLVSGKTYADGSFLFFPLEASKKDQNFKAQITVADQVKELDIARQGKREIIVSLKKDREVEKNMPMDIVFILDTTGSMGEEIERLKNTIEIINMNIKSFSSKPAVRFGLVLYRDREEDYITKIVPLTDNLERFQAELNKVEADGGGDEPEDLQAALKDSMQQIKWNKNGIKMAFIITDAPIHLDYSDETYTYQNAVKDAQKLGVKIFSIGTGGLNINGEYILRQIAQYTYGKYIFLTYGEKGESEGGKPGSVSHHTGANYQTDRLETIIIRFAKDELAFQTDQKIEMGEEYFQANKIADEKKEETLKKLFTMALAQLIDFSSININEGTPVAVLPMIPNDKHLNSEAEYFTEQLIFTVSQNKTFKMVERKDFQKILKELELQSSALFDEEKAPKIGNLLGAKVLIVGKIYEKKGLYDIFLKLIRVETGEILTVTKVKIDQNLGLK